ncbi:MAG TPA: twin transmembrane helix small protein [Steroidobacteraceae bacterium]|nr:twin transmembrane helix small protein [Steroidobacteraceae bacterium]
MKPIIVLTLLAIVASLGKALFSMSSGPEHAARVVQALSWRIGLSVALFVSLLLSYHLGWIAPNTLR